MRCRGDGVFLQPVWNFSMPEAVVCMSKGGRFVYLFSSFWRIPGNSWIYFYVQWASNLLDHQHFILLWPGFLYLENIYIYIYIFQNSNSWFCFICQLFNSQRMFFPCVKTDPKICIRVSKITKKRTWKRNRWHKATFFKAVISRSSSFTARQRFTEEPAISGLFGDRSHPGT